MTRWSILVVFAAMRGLELRVGVVRGGDGGPSVSTPDLRGLDHEGRPVGIETLADERFADLNGYVERSEAAQRALEERPRGSRGRGRRVGGGAVGASVEH